MTVVEVVRMPKSVGVVMNVLMEFLVEILTLSMMKIVAVVVVKSPVKGRALT